jgi:hypothetical protein
MDDDQYSKWYDRAVLAFLVVVLTIFVGAFVSNPEYWTQ